MDSIEIVDLDEKSHDEVVEILDSDDHTYDIIPLDSSPIKSSPKGKQNSELNEITYGHRNNLFVPSSTPKSSIRNSPIRNSNNDISIVQISSSSQTAPNIKSKAKQVPSSQDFIDDISIGEIRQTKSKLKPLIPMEFMNNELSSDPIQDVSMNISKKSLESPIRKLSETRDNSTKQLSGTDDFPMNNIARRSISGIENNNPAKRSLSETEVQDQIIVRPSKRLNTITTGTKLSKEEKQQQKAQQLQEKLNKQRYQDANRVNRKKEDLLNEMIINIPITLEEEFEKTNIDLDSEFKPITMNLHSIQNNCISWTRKITSIYDKITDSFNPIPNEQLLQENQAVLVYTAQEFISLMEQNTLINQLTNFKKSNESRYNNIIVLIIGYDSFLQKLKTQENRIYTANIRAKMNDSQQPKPRQNTLTSLTIDEIETNVSFLQIHGFKIFPTKTNHETLLWLISFTYTIASSRYDKFERNPNFANIGTIKSGSNPRDTYLKMLLQFKFMTEIKAQRIIQFLPTVNDLYKSCLRGHLPLDENGKKMVNKNVEDSIIKLFSTLNDDDLIER